MTIPDLGSNPVLYAPDGLLFGSIPYIHAGLTQNTVSNIRELEKASSVLFSWTHAWQPIGWVEEISYTKKIVIGGKHAQLLANHGKLPEFGNNVVYHLGNVDNDNYMITRVLPDYSKQIAALPYQEWLMVHSGEGCSHRICTFCGLHDNEEYVQFSPDQIADAIREANKYGKVAGLSCNIHSLSWLLDLEKCLNTSHRCYTAYVRADSDYSVLKNARRLFIGLEFLSDSVLNRIHKGLSSREIMDCIVLAQRSGIEVESYIIVDLAESDDERKEHHENIMELLRKTRRSGPGECACFTLVNTRLSPKLQKLYYLKTALDWTP